MNSVFNINVCRVCLQNDPNCDLSDKDLLDKFEFTTRLQIAKDDSLPKAICSRCGVRLKVAYNFIKTAHESEKSLRNFLKKISSEFKEVAQGNKSNNNFLNDQNFAEDDLLSLVDEENPKEVLASAAVTDLNNCKDGMDYSFSKDVLLIHASNKIDSACESVSHFIKEDDVKECYNEECEEDNELENNQTYSTINMLESNEETEIRSQSADFRIEEQEENQDFNMIINTQDEKTQCQSIYSDDGLTDGTHQKFDNEDEEININKFNVESENPYKDEVEKDEQKEAKITPKRKNITNRFYCEECNRDFSTKTNLNRHMQSHEGNKPFSCTKCKKSFTQNSTLKQHMYTHTGERPYVCEVCNRGFTQCKSLMFHMRRHTGEKPFHCEYCLITFRQKDALRIHILKHHVVIERDIDGFEIFLCIICQKKFDTKVEFKMHMKVHTASVAEPSRTKKFQCGKCFKSFALKKSLVRHMCIHYGKNDEYLTECCECDLQFSTAEEYQEHLSMCHQFACSACPQLVFKTIQELRIHMLEHDLDKEEEQ